MQVKYRLLFVTILRLSTTRVEDKELLSRNPRKSAKHRGSRARTLSLLGQIFVRFCQLRPFSVGVSAQSQELLVVAFRHLPISQLLGSFGNTVKTAIPVSCCLQGGLILLQGRRGLMHGKQQISQKFAHWP